MNMTLQKEPPSFHPPQHMLGPPAIQRKIRLLFYPLPEAPFLQTHGQAVRLQDVTAQGVISFHTTLGTNPSLNTANLASVPWLKAALGRQVEDISIPWDIQCRLESPAWLLPSSSHLFPISPHLTSKGEKPVLCDGDICLPGKHWVHQPELHGLNNQYIFLNNICCKLGQLFQVTVHGTVFSSLGAEHSPLLVSGTRSALLVPKSCSLLVEESL